MSVKVWLAVAVVAVASVAVVVNKKLSNDAFVAPTVAPVLLQSHALQSDEVRLTRAVQVSIKADREQLLTARTSGQVVQLSVREGDLVSAGDLLALMDDSGSQAEVSAAQASVVQYQTEQASIRSQVEAARLDVQAQKDTLARLNTLAEVKAASADQIQQQSVRLAQAEQRLKAAQAQLKSYDSLLSAKRQQAKAASGALEYVRLTALHTGEVAERLVQEGDIITAGTPVMRLIAADGLRRLLVKLPADVAMPAGLLYRDQLLPVKAWPAADAQGLKTIEAQIQDAALLPNQQQMMPLVVYQGKGYLLPSACFVPNNQQQVQVVLNQQPMAQTIRVPIEAMGREGVVTQDERLHQQSVLCGTSDVLLRVMAGRSFEVSQ